MFGIPSSGSGSKPLLRSAPDEKPRPAPVISTARTASSAASTVTTCFSSRPKSSIQALRESGRLSVTRPTPPSSSQMTCS
jgi:hypothetical protein